MNTSAVTPPSLKPSGSYELVRLGYVARLQNGLTVDAKRDVTGDVVTSPYLRVANVQAGSLDLESVTEITVPRSVAQRCTLRPGDVLMTEGGDLDKLGRGTVWQGELDGCLHQNHIFAVRPDPQRLSGRFLAYVTQSLYGRHYFESTGTRTTNLASTNSSKIQSFPLPLPPLNEQRRIADFLDAETARVDRMAAIRRQQIDLLGPSEASVISEYLESTAGTPTRVKHLATRITSGPRGWGDLVTDQGSLFLRITNVPRRGITLDLDDSLYVTAPSGPERERSRTRPGDVLVSITADIGSVAIVDDRATDANISQHVAMVRPDQSSCNPTWLAYAIKSARSNQFLRMNSYGGTKVGLGLGDVANLAIEVPDVRTQEQSASRITRTLVQRESLRRRMIVQRALLAERRQALITAAVTGQFDVSTASGRNVTDGVSA
ncbi:restriction endonuclease subunit S [Streptomyces sp. ActVer]|uniref:restriction endonuclease subunit S n=1 Tax=Streptomyces sp. ActVer TaxID=3014558 RepID=UPI0022B4CFBF|nr:restriction endonuclease subunit S [Streptomyces sp. ActVer]MCZ4508456.1 restriction endonuclease subunit S [Streptomyces sp. ActVer]